MAESKRYTIADIKAANEAAGRFFFSRDTLKFFKDKVSFWGVWHLAANNGAPARVLIVKKRGMFAGQVREFDTVTGDIGLPLVAIRGRVQCRKSGAIGIFEPVVFQAWSRPDFPAADTRYGRDALMEAAHRAGYEVNHVIEVLPDDAATASAHHG